LFSFSVVFEDQVDVVEPGFRVDVLVHFIAVTFAWAMSLSTASVDSSSQLALDL
jgi:hypothetical protein